MAGKSKIKINSKVETLVRNGVTWLCMHGMEWGVAWDYIDRRMYRCVRWRRYGMARYVLVGRDRGAVVPVMRGFRKIRLCTDKEVKKIHWWIKRRELFS